MSYAAATDRNTYEEAFTPITDLAHMHAFGPDDELYATPVSGDMLTIVRKGSLGALANRALVQRHLTLVK